MKYILLTAFISLTITTVAQDLNDGFFLTVDCSVNSDLKKTNPLRPKEKLCLAQQPFLGSKEIMGISEIIVSEKGRYFDLDITQKASTQLNEINKNIKNARVVFVISNEAMFVLHLSEMATINGLIRIAYIPNTDKIVQMQEKLESYLDLTKNEPTK